jgi:putative Ca2+/H+ antiporter (TMEM165/GDT1 family)
MDIKYFLTVFVAVFIAELGDKTQLATLLFATDRESSKAVVFLAASMALVASTAIGVLAGHMVGTQLNEKYLHHAAGIGFIAIGLWTLFRA